MGDAPVAAISFLDALMAGLETPRSLQQRNLIQLSLVSSVICKFGLDPIDALVFVANQFADRFPHPAS